MTQSDESGASPELGPTTAAASGPATDATSGPETAAASGPAAEAAGSPATDATSGPAADATSGLEPWGRYSLRGSRSISVEDGPDRLTVDLVDHGVERTVEGSGNGPLDAFAQTLGGLGTHVEILDYAEHALSTGGDATAAAYVECAVGDQVLWGVGIDPSITTASFKAIISAVNRSLR